MKYLLDTNICIHFLRGQFGLLITKEIMRRHKGNIQVRSAIGEGTTFKLIFNG